MTATSRRYKSARTSPRHSSGRSSMAKGLPRSKGEFPLISRGAGSDRTGPNHSDSGQCCRSDQHHSESYASAVPGTINQPGTRSRSPPWPPPNEAGPPQPGARRRCGGPTLPGARNRRPPWPPPPAGRAHHSQGPGAVVLRSCSRPGRPTPAEGPEPSSAAGRGGPTPAGGPEPCAAWARSRHPPRRPGPPQPGARSNCPPWPTPAGAGPPLPKGPPLPPAGAGPGGPIPAEDPEPSFAGAAAGRGGPTPAKGPVPWPPPVVGPGPTPSGGRSPVRCRRREHGRRRSALHQAVRPQAWHSLPRPSRLPVCAGGAFAGVGARRGETRAAPLPPNRRAWAQPAAPAPRGRDWRGLLAPGAKSVGPSGALVLRRAPYPSAPERWPGERPGERHLRRPREAV